MGLVQGFKGLIVPNGVSLNASTASVQIGGTYQLIPYITPALSKNKKVHWSTNNNNVTVDDNGLVTGITDGTSIVTVTTDYGSYTSSCDITIYIVHVTGVSLNTNSIALSAGDTYQLTATINPSNAANKNVSRRSTDTSVATVSNTGLVTCVSEGSCQIIVTTEDGNYTATCNFEGGIPSTYLELEYIDSNGTQWINTGITATQSTKSQIKVMPLGATGNTIYGYCGNNDNADYRLFNYNSQIYRDLSSYRVYGSTFSANNIYEFEIGNNYVKNVGASTNILTGTTASSYTSAGTIKLNYHDNGGQISSNRWYYVKIWNGTTLVRDMVPCYRKSDGVVGMYDKVGKTFYSNSGIGNFIIGKIKKFNSSYQQVEWIGSSATQYINTGYIPNVNTEVTTDLSWGTSQAEWGVFFGVTNNDTTSNGLLGRIYSSTSTTFNPWFYNSSYAECQIATTTDTFHQCVLKKNYCTLDGASGSMTTSGTPYSNYIYLFCGNNSGSAWRHTSVKFKTFRIIESGVIKRDFIPCYRKSDNVIGLYDLVNNTFYSNSGSGTFSKGNNL